MPYYKLVLRALVVLIFFAPLSIKGVQASSQVRVVPPGWPKMLYIPRFEVKAPVEADPLRTVNDLKAPYKWGDVAWYDRGPRPGDTGNADIIGHLDSYCCPAAFYQLKYLKPGDRVQVQYKTGKPLNFRVMWSKVYWDYQLPLKWMFGPQRQRGLILITCSGIFHYDGTGYDHKLLVFARLILPSGQLG
jgi:hypothetical protein